MRFVTPRSLRSAVDAILVVALASVLVLPPSVLAGPAARAGAAGRVASRHAADTPRAMPARLPGHVPSALPGATKIARSGDRTWQAEPVSLTFVLRRERETAFSTYLRDLYDPRSPRYRRFLTQSEIADRFGPSRVSYDRLLDYVQRHGLALVERSANRLTLTVEGTRAALEHALDVRLDEYQLGDRRFVANDRDPSLPGDIAASVRSIAGLSTLARVDAHHGPATVGAENLRKCATSTEIGGSQIACGFGYALIAALYDVICILGGWIAVVAGGIVGQSFPCLLPIIPDTTPIPTPAPPTPKPGHASSAALERAAAAPQASLPGVVTGAGQKIGITAFDTFRMSDVADFLALVGAPPERIDQVHEVEVNGGAALGANQSEVLLDVNTILILAPGADVTVYSAPFAGPNVSFQAIFNKMLDDGMTIISNSWAYCENQTTLADVESIDAIFQNAAAAGVSVFNAAGDTGSTCLNGSPNTIAVPAGAPHATAVGGSSIQVGPGGTYLGETWWDGSDDVPPTGQGGFGTSRFFTRPSYQNGLSAHPRRSIPDVVANADPAANGVEICQADAGGCPTALAYGGTSIGAPIWAAFTALLNEAHGQNLGFLNPYLYQLAGPTAFHSAAELDSDFAHVGLGSPNLSFLRLALIGAVPGAASAATSEAGAVSTTVPADGIATTSVIVQLRDARGSAVSGKTVTLTAEPGAQATIDPPSGVSNASNGTVTFTVRDVVPETVTFTATNVTDGFVLADEPTIVFDVPPATAASMGAFPTTVVANGIESTTITITLQDALGRPTPGKLVRLEQGAGSSVVTGPDPSVTDANGQIAFTATNLFNQTVTYTAIDVSDGELPVPGNAVVTFTNSTNLCGAGTPAPVGENGYQVTPFATGFIARPLVFGGITFGGCPGVGPGAFLGEHVFFSDWPGDVLRLLAAGGAVTSANRVASIGPTLGWPVVSKAGKLYYARVSTGAGFSGQILEIDPDTGGVIRTLASGLTCPFSLAVDPLSGDLFFVSGCSGGLADTALRRVRDPDSATPTVEVYANLPQTPNGFLAFAPNGTLYAVTGYFGPTPPVVRVSGTNVAGPPTVTAIPGVTSQFWVHVAEVAPNGDAAALLTLADGDLQITDLTQMPPTSTVVARDLGGGTIGPDGCLYAPSPTTVYRLTDPSGGCSFQPGAALPSLGLTPAAFSPDPAQGSTQTFTATFRNLAVPEGTPVFFTVTGANPSRSMVRTNAAGEALLTHSVAFTGRDVMVAEATVEGTPLVSNRALMTWTAGKHTTFLTLNTSPSTGVPGALVPAVASLMDSSTEPPVPIAGATVTFMLGGDQCTAVTDAAGRATCFLSVDDSGTTTLSVAFAGTPDLRGSSDTRGFTVGGNPFLGSFMLYGARPAKFAKFGPVALADGSGAAEYDVLKPGLLGLPASTNASVVSDPATHLEAYAVKRAKSSGKFAPRRDAHFVNECGDAVLTLAKPVSVLVPTAMDLEQSVAAPEESGHNLDHFLCYKVKPQKKRTDGTPVAPFPKGVQVDAVDQFGAKRYDLKKPAWLCAPASKSGTPTLLAGPSKGTPLSLTPAAVRNPDSHLLCYTAKLASKRIEQRGCGPAAPGAKGTKIAPKPAPVAPRLGVHVANQFGSGQLDSKKPSLVCLPSVALP